MSESRERWLQGRRRLMPSRVGAGAGRVRSEDSHDEVIAAGEHGIESRSGIVWW